MRDEIFKALEARWHELYDQYEAVKAALPPIVRQEWTNRSRYDPRPFHYQIHPPRGRIIEPPPDHDRPWKDYYECGFNQAGQMIMERHYYIYKLISESFYTYSPEKIEILSYSQHQGQYLLDGIIQCLMMDNRFEHYASLKVGYYYIDTTLPFPAPGAVERYSGDRLENASAEDLWKRLSEKEHAIMWHYEKYSYDESKLTHVQTYWRHGFEKFSERQNFIEYGENGQIKRITHIAETGHKPLLYRRREPGETRATLAERVKTKLVEAIPQIVAKAQFNEPLYCLSLNYYSDIISSFPPRLIPGFESDRQQTISERPPHHLRAGVVWSLIWDDEAHSDIPYPPLPITDPELLEACENFNADMRRGRDYAFMVRTMRSVARELNKLDWSKYAPVTSDFVVFDCDDTEHTRPAVSLRYSGATEQQLADWRKRGLL
jgi:hypothetical protein